MNTHKKSSLTDAVASNEIQFSNRIVMAPMTRSRAIGNTPNQLMADYYGQRSGAGLIITEGTATGPNALGYARIPGIFSEKQVEGWKKVTDTVHTNGGKIFVQLMHVGRIAHSANMPQGYKIVAPSAINADTGMWTDTLGMQKTELPQEMSLADIAETRNEMTEAAKNAMNAGFDGVEIHSANGYLLEQFLNPNSNSRTDRYGSSIQNRTRFILELVDEIAKEIGAEKIGVRISPYSTFNTMPHYTEIPATYTYLASELNKRNITYLHLVDYAARTSKEGLGLIKEIRNNFKNMLILNGGYTKERAEKAIENNETDLVSFGSPFIANPDLPYKIENNLEWTAANPSTFYTADAIGYTDYQSYITQNENQD
jgi:N-ethylmaleimide reductase